MLYRVYVDQSPVQDGPFGALKLLRGDIGDHGSLVLVISENHFGATIMRDAVQRVIDRMRAASRPELLMLLATAIIEMTILGRAHYNDEDPGSPLRKTNEAVHRLAGHLVDLCDPAEAFTESRVTGIGEQLVLLHASAITRICSLTV